MRKQDIVYLAFSFTSMALGVCLPFLADPLDWVPRATMLAVLFLSFLSIDGREVWENLTHFPLAVAFLMVIKLVCMPLLCWLVMRAVMPEFALGAAVLGGGPVAVAAPFLALMVRADMVLVLVSLVCSSLLLPLTLPLVITFLQGVDGGSAVQLPALVMMRDLSVTMFVPFIFAQWIRAYLPTITRKVLDRRTAIFLGGMSLGYVAIFAKYSGVITGSPQYVFLAMLAACVLCLMLFASSSVLSLWLPPDKQLTVVISCVAMNNILMLILSVEFFSVTEALLAALYSGPFFLSVLLYRIVARMRGYAA